MTRLQAKQLALTRLRLHEPPSADECRQTKKHISNLHRRPTLSPAGEGTFATASKGVRTEEPARTASIVIALPLRKH
jgi:hypothetical protein